MAKLKHWQGYGCLDAKKLTEFNTGSDRKKTIIQVSGSHEYGLITKDPYTVRRWLGRFIPECDGRLTASIIDLNVHQTVTTNKKTGGQVDCAIYEIEYYTGRA